MKILRLLCLIILSLISNYIWANGLKLFEANPYLYLESSTDYLSIPIYNSNKNITLTLVNINCSLENGKDCKSLLPTNNIIAPESIAYILVEPYFNTTNNDNLILNINIGYAEEGLYLEESKNYNLLVGSQSGFGSNSIIEAPIGHQIYFMNCFGYDGSALNNSAYINNNKNNITILNNNTLNIMSTQFEQNTYTNNCVAMKTIINSNESSILNMTLNNESIFTNIYMFEENKKIRK